ncbi:G2/M B-type cyclin Cdc13 [Schizosaccharomyces japonicus yFS275]|uniref:G2/M B-type cyclin Cdc13 n=1 Tax=Schizosaccharomyces japonicus (strain yFS275 / FY16936) TaxID=402676 RepID=B6K611_SCHJY|nr:G2/M B-type cyclin Cdc13 [Schizosaccharomyces japonicus yFS275]EEB08965.1 G2/M B-type cyclin Cdc13 [Schizosaccharomyces japonicus yFS275]
MTTRRLTRQNVLAPTNNNENTAAVTRLTRSKAAAVAALHGSENAVVSGKQAVVGSNATVATKKRHALNDVSNLSSKENSVHAALAHKVTEHHGRKSSHPDAHVAQRSLKEDHGIDIGPEAAEPLLKKRRQPTVTVASSQNGLRQARSVGEAASNGIGAVKGIYYDADVTVKKAKREEEHVRAPLAELSSEREVPTKPSEQDWDDLDAEDWADPLMVSEYVNEIFDYMRKLEIQTLPSPTYMDRQKELAWKMRGILTDWLIEVHSRFRLLPETLFLSVNIIDRFLSLRVCSLSKLQLVGITALFIASKYEEVMCPSVQNFVYMADGGYDEEEILQAEQYILRVLEYNLAYPNPMNFLRRISKADYYDIQTRTVAKYLVEIGLLDHRLIRYPPSQQCAAAMYIAREMLGRGPWNRNLVHYSGYEERELIPVVAKMISYLQKPVQHEAFFKKYASKKFMKASLFVRDWVKKNAMAFGDEQETEATYHRTSHTIKDEEW